MAAEQKIQVKCNYGDKGVQQWQWAIVHGKIIKTHSVCSVNISHSINDSSVKSGKNPFHSSSIIETFGGASVNTQPFVFEHWDWDKKNELDRRSWILGIVVEGVSGEDWCKFH